MSDPPTEKPPITGLVADKYELTSLIGRGGMGSVWQGRHVTLGTRVAIKFIEPELAASGEARTRFDNEARAAAAIQSKHAIQIFDHGITPDGHPYMVMEMLTGEPLDKVLERNGTMPLPQTARLIQQVCRALQRAHEAGIIHRDLKPENIFLVRNNDDDEEIAKVLDFGIAKMKQTPGQGMDSGTRTGTLLGTPFYMSPEQARGLRSVDHRADLWAMGVIGYKCVVGSLPFDGESIGDLLVNICTGPIPVPSIASPGIPAGFDAWFARACDRLPDNRFQTAQELSDALLAVAGLTRGRMTDFGSGSGRLSTAGGPPPDHRLSTGGAFTPPGRPAPDTVAARTANPVVTSAPPTAKSSRTVVVAGVGALAVGLAVGGIAFVKFGGGGSSSGTPASLVPSAETAHAPPLPSSPPPAASIPPVEPPSAAGTTQAAEHGGPSTSPAQHPPPPGTRPPGSHPTPNGQPTQQPVAPPVAPWTAQPQTPPVKPTPPQTPFEPPTRPTPPPPVTHPTAVPIRPSKPNKGAVDPGY